MKSLVLRFLVLLLSVFVVACGRNFVEKPDPLLKQETMVDIYYEIALLNSLRTIAAPEIARADIQTMPYIYRKFGIDSLTLTRNTDYYVSRPEQYTAIYDSVLARIRRNTKIVDSLRKSTPATSDTTRILRQGGVRD